MNNFHMKPIVPSLILFACLILLPTTQVFGESGPDQMEHQILSSAQPGTKAVEFKVWTDKTKEDWAKAGIPAIVRVKSSEKVHLTAIYLSPKGDLIILLPNREMPPDALLPDKEYTLFGPESPVRLKESETAKDAKIIFCVSTRPLQIDPLTIPSNEIFARVQASSAQDIETLKQKLKVLSSDPQFNLKVLTLRDRKEKASRLDLMTLPADVTSKKPIGVTGVPGAKDKIVEPTKE